MLDLEECRGASRQRRRRTTPPLIRCCLPASSLLPSTTFRAVLRSSLSALVPRAFAGRGSLAVSSRRRSKGSARFHASPLSTCADAGPSMSQSTVPPRDPIVRRAARVTGRPLPLAMEHCLYRMRCPMARPIAVPSAWDGCGAARQAPSTRVEYMRCAALQARA